MGLGRPRQLHIFVDAKIRAVASQNVVEARCFSERISLPLSLFWVEHVPIIIVLIDLKARWSVFQSLLILDLSSGSDNKESLLSKSYNFVLLVPVDILVEVLN